jgi:hypothetical protein
MEPTLKMLYVSPKCARMSIIMINRIAKNGWMVLMKINLLKDHSLNAY